jgi:drug/metabolite transporter (DMT)-like permease
MTGGRLVGVVVGFAGVAAMVGSDGFAALDTRVAAELACLAGAVSYALAGIFGRRFRRMGVEPMTAATGQVIASSIMLLPPMLLIDRPWTLPPPSMAAIGALVGLAAISTALAYVLYFRILATAGATNLLLVTFLVPVSAILLGVLVLNEALLPKQLAGMAVLGIGLAIIDGRPWQAMHRRRRAGGRP